MPTELTREDVEAALPKQKETQETPQSQQQSTEGQLGDGKETEAKKSEIEFTYPDDDSVPAEFRGKTAKEAASMFSTLHNTSKAIAEQLNRRSQEQPKPTEPEKPIFEQDEFLTGDAKNIQSKITQLFEKTAAPFVVDMYRLGTINAIKQAKAEHPHFARYENEILAEAAPLKINETADPNTWKAIYDKVVGRHVGELANELATKRPAAPVTERGSGRTSSAADDEELTTEQKQIADGLGVPYKTYAQFNKLYAGMESDK